ncbi:MAG: DUF3592 domain-containing protein [Nibricoccus sp.]
MVIGVSTSSTAKNLGLGGKIAGSLFFSVFFLMGLFFEVMVVKQTAKNLATFSWTKTEATILASEIQPPRRSDDDPTFHVRYSYVSGGSLYESRRYNSTTEAPETRDAYQLAEQFSIGSQVPCWVNPRDRAESVLMRKSPFGALLVLFPLIFVAVGAGGLWGIWFWRKKLETEDGSTIPISNKERNTGKSRFVMAGFFSIFLLVGLGIGYSFFLRPVFQIAAARDWTAVPCQILSSRVRTHSDSDGSTYSVDIVYRYTHQNRTYTSNRYHFFTGSSSGYDGKAEAVRQYPAGVQRTCYVDPAQPSSAVLDRGFTSNLWFGLIPFVFALVGGGGIYAVLRGKLSGASSSAHRQPSSRGHQSSASQSAFESFEISGPCTLAPTTSPKAKLIGLLVMAVFWNGIVSVFLLNQTWSGIGLFMGLFLLPFVAVGLGLIGGVVYQGMALFNPRPSLTVSRGVACPGETIEVSWEFAGRTDRLSRFQLSLEGREEATYRRGTDTPTDKETFSRIQLLDTTDPTAMQAGSAKVQIPAGAMHSFKAPNNKIIWALKLHGTIPRWPDVKEEFSYEIAPGGSTQ